MARIKHGKNALIDKLKTVHSYIKILRVVKIMLNVNLHDFHIINLWSLSNGSYTLVLSDKDGASVSLYFDSLAGMRTFTRTLNASIDSEADKNWAKFDRPTLITD